MFRLRAGTSAVGSSLDYKAYHDAQTRNLEAQTRKLNAEAESIEVWTAVNKWNNADVFGWGTVKASK
jgi:hypothetical protein